jgi:hypothetical protein
MNPEDLLSDALHDRVEHTDYPSTPLSAIAGRAGAIRARRRRTTLLAAAAALAVVAVPGAVWLGRSPGGSPQPGQTSSSGPTSSPTTQTSTPPTLSLDALPLGEKPLIDYLAGSTYVPMGGQPTSSTAFGSADTVALGHGGILTATPRSANSSLDDLALVVEGTAQPLGCGANTLALSTDRVESAYWVKDSCTGTSAGKLYTGTNNTMGESGPGFVVTPQGVQDFPVGILPQGVVVNESHPAGPTTPVIVAPDGTTKPLAAMALALGSDENAQVVSGVLDSETHTGGVVDARTGAVKWTAPDGWAIGQFSTDGRYALGVHFATGQQNRFAVFDAVTGDRVTPLNVPANVLLHGVVWDENDTVLAVATTPDQQGILRFDLQGRPSRATAVRSVSDIPDYYRFATRP